MNQFSVGLIIGLVIATTLWYIWELTLVERRERNEIISGVVLGALGGVALVEALKLASERRKKIKRKK